MNLSKKTLLLIFTLLFPSFILTNLIALSFQAFRDASGLMFYALIILLSLFVSIFASVFFWLVFKKSVINPITEFNRITKIINSGNLGTKITYSAKNELGELGNNINNIIFSLTRNVQNMANSLRGEMEKERELEKNLAMLREAQAKDQALLGNLGEGVVAIDSSHKIFLFNKAASYLTGFSAQEALGKDYKEVLKFEFEKETDPVPDFVSEVLNKQSLTSLSSDKQSLRSKDLKQPQKDLPHIQIVTKYGTKVPVTQSTTMITDSNQRNYGVIVVLRNITRERQLDKLKDEFVSIASHELRTPMTAIKGLISMIFEGDYGQLNPDLKEPLSDIATSTQRLIELVNDMLDVSRIEGGRIKYEISNIKVSTVVNEVLELLHPVAAQKGIELKFSQDKGEEFIQADPNKVKQILSNLVGNSLKFTDKGFIEVRYVIHDQLIIISVRDTGLGIKPEDQKKLFSKFQQVTSSQMGRPVGTGLGLYISREFAKKMGGDLWIANSIPGTGSVFSLSVPIAGSELAKTVEHNIMVIA